ncbi:MAG: hypothetical protein RPT25_16210 [Cycloclasticus sp.]
MKPETTYPRIGMPELKSVAGFDFIKTGTFYRASSSITRKYKGKDEALYLSLKLIDEDIKRVGESAYLLLVDDELVYVGEYSRNLANRWLVKGNYVWHHKDLDIIAAMADESSVTIWLVTDPFVMLKNGTKLNISKSIEQEVLRQHDLPWNKRGSLKKDQKWVDKNCTELSCIIDVAPNKDILLMKYQKAIDRIKSGDMPRADLVKIKNNAEAKFANGDLEAKLVLDAINNAVPVDSYILFMGFCPDADISERLDKEWKEKGICRFDYLVSKQQVDRFNTICKGDLVVLKKREVFGKTMKLYGHGRVKSVAYDENNIRYLNMDWSKQDTIIEVPLMACNSTVDIKSIEVVEGEMPSEFYDWLGTPALVEG